MSHFFDAYKHRLGILLGAEALFEHDGNPKRPHPILTSGKHSNMFCNGTKIVEQPHVLAEICKYMLPKLEKRTLRPAGRFIGVGYGASLIAYELARQFNIACGYTEPVVQGGGERLTLRRFDIKPGTRVLVVEDVLTTSGSTRQTIQALESVGAIVLSDIFVKVNRSGQKKIGERKIVSFIDIDMPEYEPEDCNLCALGSTPLKPKKGNWNRFIAKYEEE